jgi:hypothetical protein
MNQSGGATGGRPERHSLWHRAKNPVIAASGTSATHGVRRYRPPDKLGGLVVRALPRTHDGQSATSLV